MRIQLKRAASLGGMDYPKGIHEVSDGIASHWFFLSLVANGAALILEAPKKALESAPPVTPTDDEIDDGAPPTVDLNENDSLPESLEEDEQGFKEVDDEELEELEDFEDEELSEESEEVESSAPTDSTKKKRKKKKK